MFQFSLLLNFITLEFVPLPPAITKHQVNSKQLPDSHSFLLTNNCIQSGLCALKGGSAVAVVRGWLVCGPGSPPLILQPLQCAHQVLLSSWLRAGVQSVHRCTRLSVLSEFTWKLLLCDCLWRTAA